MDHAILYKADSGVISTNSGDELVLLSLTTETYYGLNPVGAQIWEILQTGGSVDSICAALQENYDVGAEVLRLDIEAVMRDLLDHRLIGEADAAAPVTGQ
ncbi:PqqD family protein [Cognatishimia sp. F0-27]|uniref:PqqD family protein n=1 Tax=Cognatishimia sp. F0-27 TaxID=2816855 RepID=UPI001D0CA6FA|nr:PqqD family protein [Cognatishimia sp. F0-27]MCC1493810.1 PqqD family protein [Cognatishimia sp. F0-27]